MTTTYATRPRAPRVDRPASDASLAFLNRLRDERGMGAWDGATTQREVSRMIDATKLMPRPRPVVAPAIALPDVPAGRYAFTADEGHTAFAQVDRPTRGRYVGRTFVSLLIGAPGDYREQRLSHAAQATILGKIDADGAQNAMARYGHETGTCGACNAALSDPESLRLGIGPVCRRRRGWR